MIAAKAISCHFEGEEKALFSNLDINLSAQQQALTGRNGVGKTCLATILAGLRPPSSGQIQFFAEVGYLSQGLVPPRGTGADLLGVAPLLTAYQRVIADTANQDDFDLLNDHWDIQQQVEILLQEGELATRVLTQPASELSGGERTRLALLALKLKGSQFLVLDEPTNHLDRQGRSWLIKWLQQYTGGMLLISHDYALLDTVSTIFELTSRGLQTSQGGWQAYLESRAQLRLGAKRAVAQSQQSLKQSKQTRQGDAERLNQKQNKAKKDRASSNQSKLILDRQQARSEKTQSRLVQLHDGRVTTAQALLKDARQQLENIDPLAIVVAAPASVRNPLAQLRQIVLPYVDKTLSLQINNHDRLAINGSNGSGKSTLMQLLAGHIRPRHGQLKLTPACRLMDQHLSLLNKHQSALDNFHALAPGWREDQYRTRLAQFRLRGKQAIRPLSQLSGGEQLKVALACLFCGPVAPALLLLDEPDNHLDIESKELLQQALANYTGALVLVSHDDTFIAAVGVAQTINLDHL
ncbi:MAG: ATP-binding cassette domain-containing protein [Pseudomonadales bacterium]|nr:ATP-binding cassette domain-containing protein [Pseudomonadales bacterium]